MDRPDGQSTLPQNVSIEHSPPETETDQQPPLPNNSCIADSGQNKRKIEIYGSFWISQSEFALPVGVIKEVVNKPDYISEIPLSPAYMMGLFNLRGTIVPIVDLRALLDFPNWDQTGERKIAIIENGKVCIGLLFDRTGEVLSNQAAARVDFKAVHEGKKDVVIEGVLKMEDGKRMVQVLDPFELLNIEKVPRVEVETGPSVQETNFGKRLNCISFQIGHTTCAIDLRYVQEVTDMPEIEESFLSHGQVLGVANLRGVTLPIVDFRTFMGDGAPFKLSSSTLSKRKLLVMSTSEGSVGLMVYSIDSIIPFFEHDVLPFSKLALPRNDVVAGCLISDSNEIVLMLDHECLKKDDSLVAVAASCQEVYPAETTSEIEKTKGTSGKRETFILFSIDRSFALNIASVCEVINRPDTLLEPPYALKFVEGIINLRGDLITLINPRQLYGLSDEGRARKEKPKVLIFQAQSQKFGILVDSVDEIVITTENSIAELPPFGQHDLERSVSEDVNGCLKLPYDNKYNGSVMILDVESLVARCTVTNAA